MDFFGLSNWVPFTEGEKSGGGRKIQNTVWRDEVCNAYKNPFRVKMGGQTGRVY